MSIDRFTLQAVREQRAIERQEREELERRIISARLDDKLENDLLAERFNRPEGFIERVLYKHGIRAIPRPMERRSTSRDFGGRGRAGTG